jgi:hypothetical protein
LKKCYFANVDFILLFSNIKTFNDKKENRKPLHIPL